jgi:hypothetical protein
MTKRVRVPKNTKFPNFWSLSRYNKWRGCAYQYLLECVLKGPDRKPKYKAPPSRAMERGIAIHAKLEEKLKGNVTGMPDELAKLKKEINNLCKVEAIPEAPWTLTEDFEQTYATDWNNAWLRAKIDAHQYFDDEELLIVDLKTGRFNIAQAQMDLYAAMSQFYYPDAENIRVELWFSDQGEIHGDDYTPKEARDLWKRWVKRAKDMLSDRKFLPSPGPACKKYGGCPMRSDKKLIDGRPGPCHFWKEAEKG